MASEYFKKLAQNQTKREKRELTPQEKRRNWWEYNRRYVIIGILAVVILLPEIISLVGSWLWQPDYKICYVGNQSISESAIENAQEAIAALGEDVNGDGRVMVEIQQHIFVETDMYYNYNAQMIFAATDEIAFIYLMDHPEQFQGQYGILAFPDGSVPEVEKSTPEGLCLAWEDCPGLAGIESNEFSGLWLARRAVAEGEEFPNLEANIALWEKLLGAAQ